MKIKTFLKPDWIKIILTVVITIILMLIAPEAKTSMTKIDNLAILDGLQAYKLNPLLWLPVPLVTSSHSYVYFMAIETKKIFYITIPYWLIMSYLLSSLILIKKKK